MNGSQSGDPGPDKKSTQKIGTGIRSISRRLTLGLTTAVGLVSAITFLVLYLGAVREEEVNLMKSADASRDYLVGALELPLWNYDKPTVQTIGRTLSQNEFVAGLVIKDASGATVQTVGKGSELDGLNRTGKIYHQGRLLGEVEIFFTKRYVKEAARGLLFAYATTMLFVLISLALLTHLFLRKFLKEPIDALNRIVQPYADGIYDLSVAELPYAEFQAFGRILARMGETIRLQMKGIKDAEEKYHSIFENAREGIFQCTPEGRYLSVNPALARIQGYESAEALIAGVNDIGRQLYANPQDWARFLKTVETDGYVEGFEADEYRRDGSRISVSINARSVRGQDGAILYYEGSVADITGRKRTEEALRRLTLFQRTILDNVAYGVISANPDGIVTSFNPAAERLLGYAASDVVDKQTPACWHDPEEVARHARRLSEELGETILPGFEVFAARPRRNLPEENEWTFIRKDARRIPVNLSVTALRDENDQITGFVGLTYDLTERKRVEASLRESEEKYRTLIQKIRAAVVVHGADTQILTSNSMAQEILGLSQDQLLGKMSIDPAWHFFREDGTVAPLADYPVNRVLASRKPLRNYVLGVHRPHQESDVWVLVNADPVFDETNELTQIIVTFIDISERKRMEEALRASEQRYRLVFENSPVSVWEEDFSGLKARFDELRSEGVADLESHLAQHPETIQQCAELVKIVNVNQAALALHAAANREELLARLANTFTPESFDTFRQELLCLWHGGTQMTSDAVVQTLAGDLRCVTVYFAVCPGYEATLSKVIVSLVDITERKKMEEELRRYKDHLEEEVQQRTADLVLARNAAEAANKAKSVFLASMSHELRTPLNAVLGFSNMMRKDALLQPEQRENLDIINRSGEHLLTLINDVLEMAKIEAGRVQVESVPFDLGSLVRDVTDMMHVRAQEKGLQLVVDQSSQFPRYIRGDAGRVRQVLINLLGNAVKFTEQGGVTVRLGLKSHATPQRLLIEVEDSGMGISAEDQKKVFQPFVQFGETAAQKGTGLGLSIARQFVQLMGGTISFESTLGKGSTFRVELPMEKVAAADVLRPQGAARGEIVGLAPGQAEYRILIVEDQLDNQLLLSRLMKNVGLQVKVAENGEQAVSLFQSWRPQLIWMDRRMPVMDGLQATRRIRELPGGKEVRIVAVTASVFTEQRDEMLQAGMDDFVRKPYRFNEIYECLAKQLGVQYTFAQTQEAQEEQPASDAVLTAQMLAVLPPELRRELHDALESLEGERIEAVIRQVAALDSKLHKTLSLLAGNFDYPAILKALQTNQPGDLA